MYFKVNKYYYEGLKRAVFKDIDVS